MHGARHMIKFVCGFHTVGGEVFAPHLQLSKSLATRIQNLTTTHTFTHTPGPTRITPGGTAPHSALHKISYFIFTSRRLRSHVRNLLCCTYINPARSYNCRYTTPTGGSRSRSQTHDHETAYRKSFLQHVAPAVACGLRAEVCGCHISERTHALEARSRKTQRDSRR